MYKIRHCRRREVVLLKSRILQIPNNRRNKCIEKSSLCILKRYACIMYKDLFSTIGEYSITQEPEHGSKYCKKKQRIQAKIFK